MKYILFILAVLMSGAGSLSRAESTNVVSTNIPKSDFQYFKIVSERNIFNPNRGNRASRDETSREVEKPVKVESFTLVGTMSFEKGDFAFFDSSSSDFRKSVKQSDKIAGLTLASVNSASVKFETDGKTIELPIGAQLTRRDGGEWKVSKAPSTSGSSSRSSSSGSSSGSEDSDVLKRLMERREKEK